MVELRGEGQIKTAGRERHFSGAEPDTFAGRCAVGDPELNVLLVGADALQRTLVGQIPQEELDGRIADSGLLKFVHFAKALDR